ncbi:unnamed protein product [Ceratitis capitata]|uniref:(Mediterranean fruit fly) hypothetical protein n=1 Tax=Ceratitis capitata TaxID=7213 RepID=A0A811UTS0_CERCA|nr:unnamed protein product [Ceratitis capitata]
MERTPPRRSARLMKTGSISSSIVAISTNSTMPMVSTSGSITTTATTRLDDGAPSIISVRNVVAADTAQVSRQSTEDKPTSHNIDDIEKRLAMLEATLKATQVQLASTNFCTTPRPVISAGMTDSFHTVTTQQTNDTLCAPLPITQANGRYVNVQSSLNHPKKLLDLPDFSERPPVQSTSSVKSAVTLESSNPIMSPDNSHQPLRSNNARV